MRAWSVLLAALLPLGALGICLEDKTLEEALGQAQVVYVGTVVETHVVGELHGRKSGGRERGMARVIHTVLPQINYKGDPGSIREIYSFVNYNDPREGTRGKWAEMFTVHPGMTVLIIGNPGESLQVDACGASQEWTVEIEDRVRAFFHDELPKAEPPAGKS